MSRFKTLLTAALLLGFAPAALAQEADCPAIVKAALEAVDAACSATGRNQACYGNIQLEATPREGVADFTFEQTGDLASVASLQSLQLSSMSLTDESWGVALMQLQANLPDTLPGQNVTFLLFGDVHIANAVEDAPEIAMTAASNVNVRLRPTTAENNVIDGLARGEAVTATGQLADSSWVRIKIESEPGIGWVSAQFLDGDVEALAVIEPDAPKLGPMQAFYFKTGVGDRPCAEAPDSGILVQTPKGAGRISFLANEVDIELGSTVYLQAGGGFMTVTVIEGAATLTAFGTTRLVPAGTFARVPLDANGIASGPPEFPQPYDDGALAALPVNVAVLETVEIAPALPEDEIEAAIQAAQPSVLPGLWTRTSTPTGNNCPNTNARGGTGTYPITFNPDGSFTTVDEEGAERNWERTADATYTSIRTGTNNLGAFTNTKVIIFTSPTTFTEQITTDQPDAGCQITFSGSGQWVSSP